MTYKEARAFIEETKRYGSVLGLTTMTELMKRLSNPEQDLKFIHLAGTNGKGSVLAFVSTILKCAGYRVGRYISPTIVSYRERIQVQEAYIEKEAFAKHAENVKQAVEAMTADGFPHPTCFEVETAIAFLYFREQKCDLVVLETGMGGLTDATNVIQTTVLSILSSISMDHMEYLGNTLEEIAAVKAGIIKPDTETVSACQTEEVRRVLAEVCTRKHSRLTYVEPAQLREVQYGMERQQFSYKQYKGLTISLAGSYQIDNAALAVEAILRLRAMGYEISEAALREGLAAAVWRGRFMLLGREPLFLVDGAHNRGAADRLLETVKLSFAGRNLIFIMGVFADKDYEYLAKTLTPLAKMVLTIETPGNDRALPAEELKKTVARYQPQVEAVESISEAVTRACDLAEKDDVILAFGSLSYLGALMEAYREVRGEDK